MVLSTTGFGSEDWTTFVVNGTVDDVVEQRRLNSGGVCAAAGVIHFNVTVVVRSPVQGCRHALVSGMPLHP
ncbi:hypothetical protein Hanom_Chr02g00108361 [Helianthus anomalus]